MAEPTLSKLISEGLRSSRSAHTHTAMCVCVRLAAKGSVDVPPFDATNQKAHRYALAAASCIYVLDEAVVHTNVGMRRNSSDDSISLHLHKTQ